MANVSVWEPCVENQTELFPDHRLTFLTAPTECFKTCHRNKVSRRGLGDTQVVTKTEAIFRKWIGFYRQYRKTLGRGLLHLARPDGKPPISTYQELAGALPLVELFGRFLDGVPHVCLDMVAPERPTAIICYSDLAAAGVLQAAARAGVHVPGELSVLGAGNHALCTALRPALSSLAFPARELGRHAAHLFFSAIDKTATSDVALPPLLIPRDTSHRSAVRVRAKLA